MVIFWDTISLEPTTASVRLKVCYFRLSAMTEKETAMGPIHDSLFGFVQLCYQVVKVITAIVLLCNHARKDSFQRKNRKEKEKLVPSEPKYTSKASSPVVEQD